MSKIEVTLPDDLANFVQEQVEAGLYLDAGEVVRDAVRRRMARAEEDYQAKFAALKEALKPGLEDIAAGRISRRTMDEIVAEARERASRAAE